MIDGDMLQLFIEPVEGGYRITDHGLTLHHAHTHGIDTAAKSKQLSELPPFIFDEYGQITLIAKDQMLSQSLGLAFNALQSINQQLPKWKPKPDLGNQFRARIADYFEQSDITYDRNYAVTGRSGHAVRFPFSTLSTDHRHLIHCVSQGKSGIDWGNAYSISGQMADIKAANSPDMTRHVIIDDDGIDPDTFGYLANLLTESASVLPYSARNDWIGSLAA
jgi:hypothetical protein